MANNVIEQICKSCNHALSISLKGYYVTTTGKLFRGWWDEMKPTSLDEIFKYDERLQWLKEHIGGAQFLYVLTAFWGCDHTTYYVYEYGDGSYRMAENTFAMT